MSPVRALKGLKRLRCGGDYGSMTRAKLSDLSPLQGMGLTLLTLYNTQVSDLSPLQGMPLKELWCDFKPERDTAILRSIRTLQKINDKPAREVLK